LINPPVAIPASTIKAITTQAANSGTSTQSSVAPIQTNQAFSDGSGNTTNFNNYKMTGGDYQNLQQIAATNGTYAAAAAFFNLLGVDINAFDINYAFARLDPTLKIELISLTKNGGFDFSIVKPFDTSLNLDQYYQNPQDNAYLASKIQAFTKEQFTEPYPFINVKGFNEPIGMINFDVSPTPGAGYELLLSTDSSIRAKISQSVSIDFTKPGGSITNRYSIYNIPTGYGFNVTLISPKPAPSITFAELNNMANTNNIFYLPTGKVEDGSQLFMTTALRLNNSSQLNLPVAQSQSSPPVSPASTQGAAWGLFGTYLISPTGQILFGTQQAIGNVSRK
jgi:hypothetical protein